MIALGGDGTLLRVASLFNHGPVPPVLGVSGGSLGFMMPVHIDTFPKALADVLESRAALLLRMRLECVVTEDDKDGRGKLEHAEEEEIVPCMFNYGSIHRAGLTISSRSNTSPRHERNHAASRCFLSLNLR